jgi:hypothetical protein
MVSLGNLDEERLVDELLADFGEELRATGATNFDLLDRCPAPRRDELRAMMNAAALLHWAAERARNRADEATPLSVRK